MVLVKVKQVGGELVLALNDDALALLNAQAGDTLVLSANADGNVEVSRPEPGFEQRLNKGRGFFQKYRSTFEALAK
jgi:hypothetical protein